MLWSDDEAIMVTSKQTKLRRAARIGRTDVTETGHRGYGT
jgi:hypothetical protein